MRVIEMAIKPIKKIHVSEQVFEQMKQQLICGEWKSGQKLPSENDLAEQFGVSRITIRNSLQQLAALDLVETRHGEGTFVKNVNAGNCLNTLIPAAYLSGSLLEIQEFRKMVEPGAAYKAASCATEADVADLRRRLDRMYDLKDNLYLLAQEDFAFHHQIGIITGNSLMIKTYTILTDILRSAMEEVVAHMGSEVGYKYHTQIVDAIANHDGERAFRVMLEHIEANIVRYK